MSNSPTHIPPIPIPPFQSWADWIDDIPLWVAVIQDDHIVDDPNLARDWAEIRVKLVYSRDSTWAISYSGDRDDPGYNVYIGLLPNENFFMDILAYAKGTRDWAHLFRPSSPPIEPQNGYRWRKVE